MCIRDRIRAQEALERAKERLRQKQSISEYYSTRAAMARALVRLKEDVYKRQGQRWTSIGEWKKYLGAFRTAA